MLAAAAFQDPASMVLSRSLPQSCMLNSTDCINQTHKCRLPLFHSLVILLSTLPLHQRPSSWEFPIRLMDHGLLADGRGSAIEVLASRLPSSILDSSTGPSPQGGGRGVIGQWRSLGLAAVNDELAGADFQAPQGQ